MYPVRATRPPGRVLTALAGVAAMASVLAATGSGWTRAGPGRRFRFGGRGG
jgi:hypothetical protein